MLIITLTGIDETTDRAHLAALARVHKRVEYGVLYTSDPEGRPRYPHRLWILETLAYKGLEDRVALHLCGKRALAELLAGDLDLMVGGARRLQLNGPIGPDVLRTVCRRFPELPVITQATEANDALTFLQEECHGVLFDKSGGRGISPEAWPTPPADCPKAFGYAGGLGPDNVAQQVPEIAKVARFGWWVDMEQKLRDEQDHFSVDRAQQVLEACRALPPQPGELWVHSLHGIVAVERVDQNHVFATVAGRRRTLERGLLLSRAAVVGTNDNFDIVTEDRPT